MVLRLCPVTAFIRTFGDPLKQVHDYLTPFLGYTTSYVKAEDRILFE